MMAAVGDDELAMEIPPDDPRAAGLVLAVRAGDTEAISRLLAGDPRLWHVARLLVARGARIGSLWEAAGLGDRAAVDEFLAADPPPSAHDVDEAFWQACHGGQRRMAEYLLARGGRRKRRPRLLGADGLAGRG